MLQCWTHSGDCAEPFKAGSSMAAFCFVNGKLRITNDVDQQDMCDLEFDLFLKPRPKCPEHDLEPPDAIMLIFNAARRADKGG